MTRTHVRLLGPCFKTGGRGHRPTRNRYAARAEALKETTPIPVAAEPEERGPADKSTFHPINLARKQQFVAYSAGEVRLKASETKRAGLCRTQTQ